jgi:2-polyprenyl-3-methyl-5-hydroxy-6-metoxy-1,4-benzoquinol methylase
MSVDAKTRQEPKKTLQSMEVHSSWTQQYRTSENDRFYDMAFDYVAEILGRDSQTDVVDAGCGSAVKSIQLAKRGFRVRALDFSDAILEEGRHAAAAAGYADRITFERADLTDLALESGSAAGVLCWGVLMHVPDIDRAVANLARIVAPGGRLIVSEGNFRSVQSRLLNGLKKVMRRQGRRGTRTAAGVEYWEETSNGKLMTRQADIPWLIAEFEKHGLKLVTRRAGQFSEIYTILPAKPLRRLVHAFNNAWFRCIGFGGPSFANLLVFERPK